jgi:hypothetical protein
MDRLMRMGMSTEHRATIEAIGGMILVLVGLFAAAILWVYFILEMSR